MARRALGLPRRQRPGRPRVRRPAARWLGPPATELLVPALASDAATSPRLQLRWRGRGDDDDRAAGLPRVDVRAAGSRRSSGLAHARRRAARRDTTFTGAPGATFVVRARGARRSGVYGPRPSRSIIVPLDERKPRRAPLAARRKQRRPGAWKRRDLPPRPPAGRGEVALLGPAAARDRAPLPLRRPARGHARRPPPRRSASPARRRAPGRLRFRAPARRRPPRSPLRPAGAAASRSTPIAPS